MDYDYFLNTYGYMPTIGFDTREKQAKDASFDTELCHMFGYGYYYNVPIIWERKDM